MYYSTPNIHCCIDAISFQNSHFANGTGPILLDDIDCSGSEASLLDCGVNPIGVHQCSSDHSEDAGVQCENQGQ